MLRVYFFLVLVFMGFGIQAQRILDFDKLSMEDDFSSNRANAIIQDRKGYIWIGTWNGLNQYDGYECKEYIPNLRDSNTLSNREVVALLEDTKGNIWIGTTSGLNCLNPSTGILNSFPFQNRIISLLQDSKGFIWIGTWNGGLHILNPTTREIKHFFSNDIVSDICEVSENDFWIATYNGLIRFNPETLNNRRYSHDPSNDNSISSSTITQIKKSFDGTLWIGTWGGGLNRTAITQDSDDIHFIHYKANEKQNGLPSNVIYKLYIDKFNNLWCGTWDAGLVLMEPEDQIKEPKLANFYTYKNDINDPKSLSGNNISALYVDRSGILWIGALQIDRSSIIKTGINRYKTGEYDNGVFSYRTVRSFAEQDNHLWVGTSQELKLFSKQNGQYEFIKNIKKLSYEFKKNKYVSNSILSIATNKHGLWVGTDDAGILFYPKKSAIQKKTPQFHFFNRNTTPNLPGNKINNLVPSKKDSNVVWVGSMQKGFAKLTFNNGEISTQIIRNGNDDQHISDNNIRSVAEDIDGIVWIGTQNGLNSYNPHTQKVKKYFHSFNDTTSINDNVINNIFEDSSGHLWIGTNSGINKKMTRLLPNGEKLVYFKSYPTLERIGSDIITNIIEDGAGLLWIKPYRGIVRFNPQSERPVKDYLTKEYLDLSIERNASIKTYDGTVFLGGDKGFIFFKPDSLFKNSIAPKVCLTDFLIFNESINSNTKNTIKKKSNLTVPYIKNLNLSYKDKVLTFVFSAMDYKNPQRNTYAYLLEGQDKIWNEVGARNFATYTNIPPGNYTFHVKAANSDGSWSKDFASVKLNISPPWTKTYCAFILYAIIILSILYFFKKYSVIQVREKSRMTLELMKSEKEQKLNELKTLFFTDITHEFRTPLTLIQGPAEEISNQANNSPYVKKQAEMILRNTNKLLRLVNQLMDFRKVDRGKMEILFQECNVTDIIKELYDAYSTIADSRSIDFYLTLSHSQIIAYVDSEKIEKTMYNLVSNAFKYSDDGGKIDIRVSIEDSKEMGETLVFEVEDNGIGITQQNKNRVFERFYQTHQKSTHSTGGIGLYLSKTFIDQHNGYIHLDTELGQGSCFRVVIPTRREMLLKEEKRESSETDLLDTISINEPSTKTTINNVTPDHAFVSHLTKEYNVLIVEDDYDLNDFIVSGLSSDFNVSGAYNGNEGFELAKNLNPDIIITDVMMPEMDGFELSKLLRKDISTSHIPIIFLTAKTLREHEIKGLKLGAVDYIYKPFNLTALKLKIHNVLTNQKSIREKTRTNQLLEPETVELSSLDDKLLKDAVNAVNNNLDDPTFDVDKFSLEIGLSANQAYRKIKALTGQTAKEFIRNQRLKTAASLLLQKKRSISEIIYMVGFSSPSYFTRCFKEYYKCTPKEYMSNNGYVN